MTGDPRRIRRVEPADLPRLADLCRAHAEYEGGQPPSDAAMDRLARAIFGQPPRVFCLVATCGPAGHAIGYATYAREFSTWAGSEYVHLDCLYIEPAHRRTGLGSALLARVGEHAIQLGVSELQWQTPVWNTDAITFYQRQHAQGQPKLRFHLPAATSTGPAIFREQS